MREHIPTSKLLKVILADSLQDGQEPEKTKITR